MAKRRDVMAKKVKKAFFTSKLAVVTGASSGIGKELSKILANNFGMNVIGCARNLEALYEVKREIDSMKSTGSFEPYKLDVTNFDEVKKFGEFVSKKGQELALVISNAGQILPFSKFENIEISSVKKLMDVNFMGGVYLANVFLPILKSSILKSGFIVIGSSAGVIPISGEAFYSASKAAITSFVRVLRAENQNKNVYIGLMMPGMVDTALFEKGGRDLPVWTKRFMTKAPKMASKIVKRIKCRKKESLIGMDAKLMKVCNVLFPRSFPRVVCKVLSKAGIYH